MSAAHQIKKAAEAKRLDNWMVGKKRKFNGEVYVSRRAAHTARMQFLKEKKLVS